MNIPVMICGFIRPNTLEKVFAAVREVKPCKLYLVLDAPREGRIEDVILNNECKRIFDSVDWVCDVVRDYAKVNMGCGKRMTSAITNVFKREEMAIILEDDCVPHPSFFRFCEELLERYKNDTRVGMIGAECAHFRKDKMNFYGDSYYFDRMATIGAGWATWRRAWMLHDPTLPYLNRMIETGVMKNIMPSATYIRKWENNIKRIKNGLQKTWAGAWATTVYKENMLVIHSVVNPVVNIGQGGSSRLDASGEVFHSPVDGNKNAEEIEFPLQHPISMIPNIESELYCMRDMLYMSAYRKFISNPKLAVKRLWRNICK